MVEDFWLAACMQDCLEEVEFPEQQSEIRDFPVIEDDQPVFTFEVDNIIAVKSDDSNLFWLAKVTKVTSDSVQFQYYDFKLNSSKVFLSYVH